MEQQFNGFENNLGKVIYSGQNEKAFTDKITAMAEIGEIKDLIEKDQMEASDLRKLVYLLNAAEIKLVNLGEQSRYILGKFTSWIYDIVEVQQIHIRNMELMKNRDQTDLTLQANKQIYKVMDENIKKVCGSYLYWTRSSLSLSATAFDTLSKSRYEYEYTNYPNSAPSENKSIFNIGKGGKT